MTSHEFEIPRLPSPQDSGELRFSEAQFELRSRNGLSARVAQIISELSSRGVPVHDITYASVARILQCEPSHLWRVRVPGLGLTEEKLLSATRELCRQGNPPTIPQLMIHFGVARTALLNAARRFGIELADHVAPVLHPERKLLSDILRKHAPEHLYRTALSLFHQRKITFAGLRTLVYAINIGSADPAILDASVARVGGLTSKAVSAILLSTNGDVEPTLRRRSGALGVVGYLDHKLHEGLREERRTNSRERTYREFERTLRLLSRVLVEKRWSYEVIARGHSNSSLMERVRELAATIPLAEPAKPQLNETQRALLEAFLADRETGGLASRADIARQVGVTNTAAGFALFGRTDTPGGVARLVASAPPQARDIVQQAADRLIRGGCTPDDIVVLRQAISRTENASSADLALSPLPREALTSLLSAEFDGTAPVRTVSRQLDISESHASQLLNGEGGVFIVLQRAFDRLAESERKLLILPLSPPDLSAFEHGMVERVRECACLEGRERELKLLRGLLGALVHDGIPALRYRDERGVLRSFSDYERRLIIDRYLEGRDRDLSTLAAQLQHVIGRRTAVRVTPSTLHRFFYGRGPEVRHSRPGVVRRFNEELTRDPIVGTLSSFLAPLAEAHLPTVDSILREIGMRRARSAGSFIQAIERECVRRGWGEIILGEGVPSDLFATSVPSGEGAITLWRHFALGPRLAEVVLSVGRIQGEKVDTIADLFVRGFEDSTLPNRDLIIQSLANLARPGSKSDADPIAKAMARRVHKRVIDRLFAELSPGKLSLTERYDVIGLISRRDALRASASEDGRRIIDRLKEFYAAYQVETVIRAWRGYLIASSHDAKGVPLDTLIEVGDDAVRDAARLYDPEKYRARGAVAPAFKNFAVQYIKWRVSQFARDWRRDRRVVPGELDRPIGDDITLGEVAEPHLPWAESHEGDDDQMERLTLALDCLPALPRALIELRFGLGSADPRGEYFDSIAQTIFERGLTAELRSREWVRRETERAMTELRALMLRGSSDQWTAFLRDPIGRRNPDPLGIDVTKGVLSVGPLLALQGYRDSEGNTLVIHLERVIIEAGEVTIFVSVRDLSLEKAIGAHEITIIHGEIGVSERLLFPDEMRTPE